MKTLASAVTSETDHFAVGETTFGKFLIKQQLGKGAMGNVYLAEHTALARPVAIKVLHPELCSNELSRQRFVDEGRILASLKSPHTVRIIDAEISGSQPYLVMEYVEGTDLGAYMKLHETYAPDLRLVLNLARQVALGLAEAHDHGIVHRDVKPENVLVTRDNSGDVVAKVADFGIAKRLHSSHGGPTTLTGTVLGTPYYMAPEQFVDCDLVDQRADIFAFGVLLYEMCCGSLPFGSKSGNKAVLSIMYSIIADQHVPLHEVDQDIPLELSQLVDECLRKDPSIRLSSARYLAKKLNDVLSALQPCSGVRRRRLPLRQQPALDQESVVTVELPAIATLALPSKRMARWWPATLAAMAVACVAVLTLTLSQERTNLHNIEVLGIELVSPLLGNSIDTIEPTHEGIRPYRQLRSCAAELI